jgi:hypothetical protein
MVMHGEQDAKISACLLVTLKPGLLVTLKPGLLVALKRWSASNPEANAPDGS